MSTNDKEQQDPSMIGNFDAEPSMSKWPPDKAIEKREEKTAGKVEETKEAGDALERAKGKLLEYWKDNDKDGNKTVEGVKDSDDFKILVFSIKNKKDAKDIYLLLSLIEATKGKEEAKKIYEKAIEGKVPDSNGLIDLPIDPFIEPFKAGYGENAKTGSPGRTFGFYYCTKNCHKGEAGEHKLDKNTQGWFTYDVNEDSQDEYSGTDSISIAWKHIQNEFKDPENRDDSLTPQRKKLVENAFEALDKEDGDYKKLTAEKNRETLLTWFQTSAKDKWTLINDDNIRNLMNSMYGASIGSYFYRYDEKSNKIYFIAIKGEESVDGKCGYIDVTNKGVKTERNFFTNGVDGLKDTLLKDMAPDKILQEAATEATKRGDKELEDSLIESTTKGLLVEIHKKQKERTVKYSRLQQEYLDVLEEELKKELEGKNFQKDKSEKMAKSAISNLKEKVDKKIQASDTLKEAVKPENDEVLSISLDDNGEPLIDLRESEAKSKIAGKVAEIKEETEGALDDQLAGERSAEMIKKLGPLGAILSFFGVDLKKDIMDALKPGGKKSFALTVVGFLTSIEIGRRVLKGKGFSVMKDIEAIAGENNGVLKKDEEFKKDLKLEGYKITIPKGKGIKLSDEFVANGVELKKPVKKKSFNPFSFGNSDKEFVMDDQEIIITDPDVIPQGTVIPQGAKIEKIAAAVA